MAQGFDLGVTGPTAEAEEEVRSVRSFECACGNEIFFENTVCVSCQREVGWCAGCRRISALVPAADGGPVLACAACQTRLRKCHNYAVEQVCNRCTVAPDTGDPAAGPLPLCDYCRFNETIPDLSIPGNRERWRRLEAAKRRLLYTLDLLGLPYGTREDGVDPPLRFEFKGDPVGGEGWWPMGDRERVYTGHVDGRITINIEEADAVAREQARVRFEEAHRTVVGHFRHEIGHYYWQMLVQGVCEPAFVEVFGDHEVPTYAEAQRRYYEQGPVAGWQSTYLSAYASMHPWEDFAEIFATYLGVVSVLDTARNLGVDEGVDVTTATLATLVDRYCRVGVVINEMNRAMGLIDLVPEIFTPAIVAKLEFVHRIVRRT